MPKWIPNQIWLNQDVFIIGGGNSLKRFDWNLLKKENTIGCNDAFKHGAEICKVCVFGDSKWFEAHKHELELYKGAVFTNVSRLYKTTLDWLWVMKRQATGLHRDALGWNYNTGAVAINLALLLGAKRIFLLGFDMCLSRKGKQNWHPNNLDKPNPEVYLKFIKGFKKVAKDLREKFPDVEVFNVTDNSKLDEFPKVGMNEFWKERQFK